ncbi:hypothetical protein Taro_014610 [Colocasia esculenta]|uniref:Uncharacterized protein n=1 Tax=Colocasia esculenta TaxID=4460 RepID=A0A843UIM1_COLES|nr:hypothetical protein [Colocasia esculenta]
MLKESGTNISCKGSVDTTINGVDTMVQNKAENVKKRSSSVDTCLGQVDTTSSQVDTRDLSQGINCQSGTVCRHTSWVDTLRNLCDLTFLLDTWHPWEMMDQSWISCPRTPRVSFGY